MEVTDNSRGSSQTKSNQFTVTCLCLFTFLIVFLFPSVQCPLQRAKKVVSDSPGLVDFAIGLVDFAIGLVKSVFNLPDGQVMFFEEFE